MRKKNQNGATPFSWQIAKIGGKNDFPSVKISQDREMVQTEFLICCFCIMKL